MKSALRVFGISFVLFQVGLLSAVADTVTMKNGDVYRGKIIDQVADQYVQVKFKDDNEKRLQWADIEKVDYNMDGLAPTATPSPAPSPLPSPSPSSSPSPSAIPIAPEAKPEAAQPAPQAHWGELRWHFKFNSALTVGNNGDITIKTTSGSSIGAASVTGKVAPQFGVELGFRSSATPVAVDFVAEWNTLTASSAPSGATGDKEFGLFVVPKVVGGGSWVHPWAGVGLGLLTSSYADTTSASGNITVVLASNSSTAFALSPRAGIDMEVGDAMTLGFQAAYTAASGSVPFTATDGVRIFDGAMDYSLSWFAFGLSFGFKF